MAILSKSISKDLTLIETNLFPWLSSKQSLRKREFEVWLGIGGNIGDTLRRFEHLIHFLKLQSDLRILESSPILRNPPFGYLQQPDFYNAVLRIATPLSPYQLLRRVQRVEHHFRRVRTFQDAPRTLDIDIIFYEDRVYNSLELTIPHRGWRERQSVLIPLKMMDKGSPNRWRL